MNQRKVGAVLSYGNILANIIVGLVYTPIMLRILGQSEYGLYSLIGSVVGYLSILDLGLGNTIVRYTARNRVIRKNEAELNGLFLLLYTMIGFLAIIFGSMLYANMDDLFGRTLTSDELFRGRIMMLLLIFNFAFTFPLSTFSSIIQAYERFIYLRIINIIRVLLNPCIVLPFLLMGYGSIMMVVVSTVLNLGCLLVNMWYCFRYLHTRFKFAHIEMPFLREVAAYSFFIFLNILMNKFYYQSGQIVLGIVANTKEVAVYAISMQIIGIYMGLSTAISGVLLPKLSMMIAEDCHKEELDNFMIKVGRIQYFIVVFICSMFFLKGKEFLYLWAGEEYISAYWVILLVMVVNIVPLIQNTGYIILQAMNLNRFRSILYLICSGMAVLISFPLGRIYGSLGCTIAMAIGAFLSAGIIINLYYAYIVKLNIRRFWTNILNISCGTIAFLIIGLIETYFFNIPSGWINFVWHCIILSFIYFIIIFKMSFNTYEHRLFSEIIRKSMCFIYR